MIGTSGTDALSRAVGDEQVLRTQRSENKPNRENRQRRNKNKRKEKKFEDMVEMSTGLEQVEDAEADAEAETPAENRESTEGGADETSVPPEKKSPRIDVTG